MWLFLAYNFKYLACGDYTGVEVFATVLVKVYVVWDIMTGK
jgi:hypothetical protein